MKGSAQYFHDKQLSSFIKKCFSTAPICFGCGGFALQTINTILNPNGIIPLYYVDNDISKQGGCFFNLPIKEPRTLRMENDNTLILITTLSPLSIKEQLDDLGKFDIYASCFFFDMFMGKYYRNISLK